MYVQGDALRAAHPSATAPGHDENLSQIGWYHGIPTVADADTILYGLPFISTPSRIHGVPIYEGSRWGTS